MPTTKIRIFLDNAETTSTNGDVRRKNIDAKKKKDRKILNSYRYARNGKAGMRL